MGKKADWWALGAMIVIAAAVAACGQQSTNDAGTGSSTGQTTLSAPQQQASAETTTPPPAPAAPAATAPTPQPPAPPPYVTVSAQQLYADYHANEVLADTKYKARWLYVRGTVSEIGKDFSDDPYVNLIASDNEFESVRAEFAKAAIPTLATLHKGNGVSLMCFGKGMLVGSPILDCAREGGPPMPSNSAPATTGQPEPSPAPTASDNTPTAAQTPQQSTPQASGGGAVSMWIGNSDMNLRSCPGTTCSAVMVIPKHAKVDVDLASIRNVTESSGAQTPWARITYSGPYCDPKTIDQQTGCVALQDPSGPTAGWVNYQRLSPIPSDQQTSATQ